MEIEQSLELAARHLDAGRLDDAEAICRDILQAQRDACALHFLGLIEQRRGHTDLALPLLLEAVELDPEGPEFWYALGAALANSGDSAAAIATFSKTIELKPDAAEAHYALGTLLKGQGRLDEAAAALTRAIELKPDFVHAYCNLGIVRHEQRKLDDAIASFSIAIQLQPDLLDAHCNLGIVLHEQRNYAGAVAEFSKAIELMPDLADAYCSLGMALHDQKKLDEAIAAFTKAIELKPDCAGAHNNLGVALKDQGRLDEALACFDREIALHPQDAAMHSNRIYTIHYDPRFDAAALLREQRCWDQRHAEPLKSEIQPHLNDASPNRRLKIGYVSPDFSLAPVGRFLLPLLENHDHTGFEIFCYSDVRSSDAITAFLHSAADVWRDTVGLSHEKVAQLIRQDRIDILVDLTMHMAYNRLLVFARKPAPVQVTYLAYPSTTGMDAMDYRLTDPYLDPPGQHDEFYTERSSRLPETYWCYRPGVTTPPTSPLPALSTRQVTFGCLNNFCKVTPPALETWCKLLRTVPNSRLILHSFEGRHRRRINDLLEQHGVGPKRLTFVGFLPGQQYFQLYQEIDIALDPFPYGGGTTSCDAMWMGAPVVSLAGLTGVSRGGLSLLSNVGLPELVAHSPDEYVRIAADLAQDLERLKKLRSELRDRMLKSPLMDAKRFAANVEAAYRHMWENWCSARALPPT